MSERAAVRLDTPIGPMSATFEDGRLLALRFGEPAGVSRRCDGVSAPLEAWVAAYFDGADAPCSVPLAPAGTAFQRAVWAAVGAIPRGRTASYAEIAADIGRPGSVRAVGAANGANPWPLIVPCHRVIGGDGTLTGYVGGLAAKEWLLRHEGALLL